MKKISEHSFFKDFVLKLVFFLIVLFSLDRIAGLVLEKYYFKQIGGFDYLTTEAIDKTKADLIVFGSSRAVNIFNTEILEQRSGLSSYNAGKYGQSIFYHYAVLKAVLKRHQPKFIMLSFDAGNFSINVDSYDRISALNPYYKGHPEIRSIVMMKSRYEKIKLLSASYPYNSLLLAIITGNTAGSQEEYANSNGYIPINKVTSEPVKNINYTLEKDLDSTKINIYVSFLKECQAAKIPLVVICPPYLVNAAGNDKSILKGKEIADDLGIKFMDFSKDTFYANRRHLFADYRHLNASGTEVFSNVVMDDISIKR